MVSTCQDSPAPPKPSKTPVFLANQTPCEDEDALKPEAPRKLMIGDQRRPPFLWTWCVTIQDNARKLTQHREQLRKGKEAAFSLGQCLRRLFTQEETARAVQRHREELVEACKLADHLVLQLHIANCGSRTDEEEKEPLYQVDDQSSDFSFLIQAQARELTQLRKKLEAGRNVAFILQRHLKDLITDNDFGESQGQSLLQLAEWRRLAERLTLQLGSEHHCDTEDEEETESLDSSDEQQDEKVDELLSGSVAERSLLGPGRPDPPYQQQHCISVAVPAEEHEASPAQDGTKPEGILKPQEEQAAELSRIRDLLSRDGPGSREGQSHRDHAEGHKLAEPLALQPCPEPGSWRTAASPSILTGRRGGSGRHVRFLTASAEARAQGTCPQGLPSPTFEVPEDHCVGTQPGQYLDRGAGRATLSLSSAPWRFIGHTDAGQQWLHSTELNLDASLGLENPPKAEGDALGGSGDTTREIRAHGRPDATAVPRQRMERKPRFRQWKMACRFPGAQA
ncbi:neuroblastoma breakpoint family member 6-like isoform X2 [Fukomys damarensis]|uniref:neuroblastoma breakpoint family member 6-like isoform X2 n=1 Tax=Fukomys damarensis TaxID=885580 RepID=UPI00053F4BD1|nr:neuroblastoma breakpoint family member 6-like isoform X2 [Fukomys damarensis]